MIEFKEEENFQEGAFFVVDKPLGWTSFQVVNKLKFGLLHQFRGKFKKIKIGHAGTLDPLATGVVIVCTGRYTKRIEDFQGLDKEYIATLKVGATTPCYDAEQPEDKTYPFSHITKELIEEQLKQFVGEISQIPPNFSALRIKGKRAYDCARAGQDFELKSRPVKIESIEFLSFEGQELRLKIVCGKGTYIRSIARDLGEALGSGAYLTGLIRSRIGSYDLSKASDIESCLEKIKNYH
ncbi:tRNA pseudouridine55 synthase [Balneicella halophila]|uniref:tRNA pseudouridine synthase B n=1 Tax=Balneicella halophila TaxID=1537566 RepID=A0A7L4UT20_BALHA|nr:tRNA pseudouridine(55) synthase TruB [Balneicella halophila]PVX52184.1 tRNA pseudouridine55 synthase [Balneicella halophila]